MRLIWTVLAMGALVVGCHDNDKPAEDPSTTSGTVGPVSQSSNGTTSTSGTQSTNSSNSYNNSISTDPGDPSLRNPNATSAANNPAANGYGSNNAGPPPSSFGNNASNSGATSGYSPTSPGTGSSPTPAPTTGTTDSDRQLTQNVQAEIAKINGLSTGAKQVDVSANSGRVTLKGEVKSETEHQKLVKAAKKIAGDTQVDDQITIKK